MPSALKVVLYGVDAGYAPHERDMQALPFGVFAVADEGQVCRGGFIGHNPPGVDGEALFIFEIGVGHVCYYFAFEFGCCI